MMKKNAALVFHITAQNALRSQSLCPCMGAYHGNFIAPHYENNEILRTKFWYEAKSKTKLNFIR